MRSLAKDIRRMVTVSTITTITGATGTGIFSDGTSFVWNRTSTGNFDIRFDSRLIPINAIIDVLQFAGFGSVITFSPGFIYLTIGAHDGSVQNYNFKIVMHWLDTR